MNIDNTYTAKNAAELYLKHYSEKLECLLTYTKNLSAVGEDTFIAYEGTVRYDDVMVLRMSLRKRGFSVESKGSLVVVSWKEAIKEVVAGRDSLRDDKVSNWLGSYGRRLCN